MKNKNYFTKYLILVLPLLFINLNAQDQVDPLEAARLAKSAAEKAQAEADAATEAAIQSAATKAAAQARENAVQAKKDAEAKKIAEAKAAEEAELDALAKAAGDEAKRKIAQELGLDDGSSEEEATAEETENTEAATEEVEVAEETDAVEELEVKEELGWSVGAAPSIGFVSGASFTSVPVGATIVITTPYGFKLGPLDFTISAAFGGYSGSYDTEKADEELGPGGEHSITDFNPTIMGIGGNLTLAKLVFIEGHAGIVGKGPGIRGFAGMSIDLGLPVKILVGGEGFITTSLTDAGNTSGWGGLGVRLDYDF
jgi:hypothetical protein